MGHSALVYSRFSKILHWSMALLILGLLFAGFWMVGMAFSPQKLELYALHKSFGMLVFGFGAMRLIWRFITPAPAPLESHQTWEKFLAKTIHCVFYISFFGMPLSGWAMSNAGEFPNIFFGLFEFPHIASKNERVFETLKWVHEAFAFGLIAALGLHVAGALKHHVIDRDATLVRMGGRSVFGVLALGLFAAVLVLKGGQITAQLQNMAGAEIVQLQERPVLERQAASSDIQNWLIDMQASSLGFQFTQYGQAIHGRFDVWGGEIYFDPERLDASRVFITIDPASIRTGSADRDVQAQDSDWFSVSAFPEIVFESESFRLVEPNRYEVSGFLRLRDVEKRMRFTFLLTVEQRDEGQKRAVMQADFTLDRLDFGVGQGAWKSTETIGNAVKIDIDLEALTP